MKLKLSTSNLGPSQTEPTPTPTPSTARPGGKISLKLSKGTPTATPATPSAATVTPKASKKTTKKRKAGDDDARASLKKIKTASKPTLIRLKSSKAQAGTPKTPIAHINIKAKGKIPVRPYGVGYDSEAEDAEDDPSIEENIILRMQAGPDCDLLRKAIEERRLGAKPEENGVRVSMRFFGKDGRRASVSVGDHHYGAILVDLPTIIESMKSWDKRGWWKSADICQMLLVLGSINAPEDAKTRPLPRELDQSTWQWPHGLTPPMYNVRKRRFRKRVSYRTIEAAEQEVERLLEEDAIALKMGGNVDHEVIDLDELREQEEMESEGEYEEVDMADSQMQLQEEEYDDEEDEDAAAARLALELGEDDDDEEDELAEQSAITISTPSGPGPSGHGLFGSGSLAPGRLNAESTSPAAGTTSGDNDDEEEEEEEEDEGEEDSGDDDDSDDEIDGDAREEAQQKQQQMEDIAQLDVQLLQQRQNLANVTSAIFRSRIAAQIKTLEAERDVKRRAAGLEDDNDG